MGHGRDKPKREVRKPKKEKLTVQKSGRESEVLQHVSQHPQNPDPNRS